MVGFILSTKIKDLSYIFSLVAKSCIACLQAVIFWLAKVILNKSLTRR